MIHTCWYQIHAAGYAIDPDDALPFIYAAEMPRCGTTYEDLAAAATLLSFTRDDQVVDEEMSRGIREL